MSLISSISKLNYRVVNSAGSYLLWNMKRFGSTVLPFKLADIGEGIAEVELMKWFIKKGDTVKAFDRICEVQSDKATVEITSRYNGIISTVYHEEGSIVKVGESLVDIQIEQASGSSIVQEAKTPGRNLEAPSMNDIESENLSYSRNSSIPILDKVLTTPAVRKIAKENQIDLATVHGSGPKGRILKEDILRVLNVVPHPVNQLSREHVKDEKARKFVANNLPSNDSQLIEDVGTKQTDNWKKVPIRGVQRLMVKTMNAANEVQHLTLGEEVIFTNLVRFRKELKVSTDKLGIKLSYLPFIVKATSLALVQFPMLNATVNSEVTEVTQHAAHNIGVAVDTPKGLMVPVIKNVQSKSIFDIAKELAELQSAAMNGSIKENQLQGGTFSLSNIGSIGGTYAVPVLVVPQVVIGAVGRMQVVPRYVNDNGGYSTYDDILQGHTKIEPVPIVNVSWSADHRVIDGATVARFSNYWKNLLECPSLIALHTK